MGVVEIELLYFAGCPNWQLVQDRLRYALQVVGHADQEVALRLVESDAQARAMRFPGSPTIHVDGSDPFPSATRAYGLTCRVYTTPDGIARAPTVDQLVQALTSGA